LTKEKAARMAAANHSTDPVAAVVEYAKLTKEKVLPDFNKIQKEFLDQLPPYRHPVNGEEAEWMIYFDPNCLEINGSILEIPQFLFDATKDGMTDELLAKIKKYVLDAERDKVSLAQAKSELTELKNTIATARQVYHNNLKRRPDWRNARVAQTLGLSSGNNPKHIDGRKAYMDYVMLVRREGQPRKEAVKEIQKRYGYNSYNSTLKALYQERKLLYDKWEELYPSDLPEIRKRLERLIPARIF